LFKYPILASRITITGTFSKKQLADYYTMADVGVVPSYVEQCSYTTIEMMLFKLPIVASQVDGLKEMITEETGFPVKFKGVATFEQTLS